MHFSKRSKLSILLSLVTMLAIVGAFAVTTLTRGTSTHAAGSPAAAVKGTGVYKGSLNLHNVSVSKQTVAGQPVEPRFKVNRSANNGGSAANVRSSNVPQVAASPLAKVGTVLQNFNGVSSADSLFDNGFDVEPPDQGLCVDSADGVVLELVNLAGSFYSTTGTLLLGPIPLNIFFGESPAEFISDPRCQFDTATDSVYLTVLAIDPSGLTSHIDVTVANPTSFTASVYSFDTTDAVNPNCPCFADQPLLGIDAYNLYVSGNEFGTFTNYFGGAEVFAISKSQLAAMVPLPNFAEFLHISDAGIPIETLQPAITYDPKAPAEYLLHSFTVDASGNNNSFDHRLGVFAITNQAAVTTGGFPTLSNPTIINSEFYAQPNFAANPNSFVLNADDDRMQQVEYINGNLMGALSTAVSIKGDSITRDGAAWFDIEPSLQGSLTVKAHIKHQGYIAASGLYVLYPAITQSKDGTVEMAFSISSSTIAPSAAYAVIPDETKSSNAGQVFVAASGTGPDTGFTCSPPFGPSCRWGDYSWATLDPGTTNIWMASEYIPPVGSQSSTFGGFANWGTDVYEVKA